MNLQQLGAHIQVRSQTTLDIGPEDADWQEAHSDAFVLGRIFDGR